MSQLPPDRLPRADFAAIPRYPSSPEVEVNLSEKDESGAYRRSIVKVTNPERFGITVGDYFV